MPVHPLSIGAVTVDQKCEDGTLRTGVLILTDGRLEPADQHLTRERVDLESPDGLADAVASQVDVDHGEVSLCVLYHGRGRPLTYR